MSTYNRPSWSLGSTTYDEYLAASKRCADAMRGIIVSREPETKRHRLVVNGEPVANPTHHDGTFPTDAEARIYSRTFLREQARERARAASGAPRATQRQVRYLLDLIAEGKQGRGPLDPQAIARLTKVEASAYISRLNSTRY